MIDLSFTTIKQPLPDFIYDGLRSFSTDSNSYHHQPAVLRQKIADHYNVPLDYIQLTAGADQAILFLSLTYGQKTHIFTPTYIGYTDVQKLGGELVEHPALEEGTYTISTDKIPDASLIFLANPNNPAGITPRKKVLELVVNNPQAIVVIDEAYADFADESVIGDVKDHKNLVVVRSFSKSHALAGYRIGYMVAAPELLGYLELETTWFNVAYTSVGAAAVAIDYEDHFADLRQDISRERERTATFLRDQNYTVITSSINALLVKFETEQKATDFVEKLKQASIKVNHGNGPSNCGLDKTFVRISVGTTEQMQALRRALKQ
jgi:histidinol-phosphate aminotransferase